MDKKEEALLPPLTKFHQLLKLTKQVRSGLTNRQ